MFRFKFFGIFIAVFSSLTIQFPLAAAPIYGVANMGIDFGGDKIGNVGFTNGHICTVRGGQGLYLSGGIGSSSSDGKYDGQVTLGLKYRFFASDCYVDWSSYPLEVLGYINLNKIRLGGGITYHMNPTLERRETFVDGGFKSEFNNALGIIMEAQYQLTDSSLIGGRMTIIDYEIGSRRISGNSVGMNMTFPFAK